MKKFIISIALLGFTAIALTGCASTDSVNKKTKEQILEGVDGVAPEKIADKDESVPAVLEKISAKQAKEMMEQQNGVIILDVRTVEEFKAGFIDGAILIPDYDLENKAEEVLEDKSATLLVYCRSGRRSAQAAKTLHGLGYTNVFDFGGILDWPYETVIE